jgi:hypothetical protein
MMIVILFTKPARIDPHENCVNYIYIIAESVRQVQTFYGCHTCLKIAIYVVKTKLYILLCTPLHRGAFCHSKSTGKKTGKTHLCAL